MINRERENEKALTKIAAIVEAHFHGDDGELTPGQSRQIALDAIREVIGGLPMVVESDAS